MIRFVVKIVLSALAFIAILPMIPGIDFHGNFMTAVALSIVFGIMLWLVELIAFTIAAVWTVSTVGMALLWLIPLWILGFWLLPACALILVANFMPAYLTVTGWIPAILAGLVMLAIGMVTSRLIWREAKKA